MAEATTQAAAPAAADKGAGIGRTRTDGTSLKAPPAEVKTEAKTETTEVKTDAKVEAKTETKKEPDEKERRAERFAKLAREELAIRAERERVKAREKEIETKESAMSERLKTAEARAERLGYFDKIVAQAKQNTPEGRAARQQFLQETGLDFKLLAKDVVEGDKVDPRALVQAELDKFRAEQTKAAEEQRAKEAKEAQTKQTQQQIANVKASLRKMCEDSGDKYELTRYNGASDAAYDLMVKQYTLDKTILSPESALERIESDLERQEKEKFEKSGKLRKLIGSSTVDSSEKQDRKAGDKKSGKEKTAEPSFRVGKPAASEQPARGAAFDRKAHVNELLARHRSRMNTT